VGTRCSWMLLGSKFFKLKMTWSVPWKKLHPRNCWMWVIIIIWIYWVIIIMSTETFWKISLFRSVKFEYGTPTYGFIIWFCSSAKYCCFHFVLLLYYLWWWHGIVSITIFIANFYYLATLMNQYHLLFWIITICCHGNQPWSLQWCVQCHWFNPCPFPLSLVYMTFLKPL